MTPAPRTDLELWKACLEGREPAESLTPWDRELLVTILLRRGWTLPEVAAYTRQTTYTTWRIAYRVRWHMLNRAAERVAS